MTRYPRSCVALIAIATATGCADLESEAQLDEAASELSVSSWSAPVHVADAQRGASVASVNGTTVMVRTECCFNGGRAADLAWHKRTSTGSWTSTVVIPGQQSDSAVSLAGFNGSIYMVRRLSNSIYLSHFNLATSTWSTSSLLPYQSSTMPTIAAFQNQLRFVGTTPGTSQLWTATMNTSEVFSTATLIPGKYSNTRVSSAVFKGRLYLAHAQAVSNKLIYSSFDGTTWSANQFLFIGTNGASVNTFEPTLAAVNGFLHLAHVETQANLLKWSYFDGCAWTPQVSIGTQGTYIGYSLTQAGPGLVLSTSGVSASEFTAPPAPRFPPPCGVINP